MWSACFSSFTPEQVYNLMLNCICKYFICRIYPRGVQSFVKDGVGGLPPLLHLAAVTQMLVQRWPLPRRMLCCAQVFHREGLLWNHPRSWISENRQLELIFAGFVEMHLLFLEVVVAV